jgi:hypothetical protein
MKISRGILEKTYSLKTNIFVKSCHLKMLRAIAATEEETEIFGGTPRIVLVVRVTTILKQRINF